MSFFLRVLPSLWLVSTLTVVHAQVPFPPPALTTAQSFEAAAATVGASKPEFSSYLLLDIPEISPEGTINAVVKSELPGTSHLILIRQFPVSPDRNDKPAAKKRTANAATVPQKPATQPPTVFVAARQFDPGEAVVLSAKFEFSRNERFTVLAFAQGKWFGVSREMKLAREIFDRP